MIPERTRNVQHEWSLQRSLAVFLGKALPETAYWTSIDVGRSRSAAEGQLRKLRGIKAGIPDVMVAYQGVTLWLEAKVDASLSPAQKTTREALLLNGHCWALVRSMEDVELACRDAGIPLRATLGEIRTRIAEQKEGLAPKKKRTSSRPRVSTAGNMSIAQYHRLHAGRLV